MPEYQLGYTVATKTASVVQTPDALPVGAVDCGTFDHDTVDDEVHPHADNHALYHHVRDTLYGRKALDGATGATYPNGIYDMQAVTIEKYGDIIAAESLAAEALSIAAAANDTIAITYEPAGAAADAADFSYVSADPSIATVNASGVVTGVLAGSTTVTATQLNGSLSVVVDITIT